ncbi:MAG: hypothetical protein IPP19_14360 [Verrucomicrobia bacterium]|nr:hypothetical protein [Verrucomicrobiota bacterium]
MKKLIAIIILAAAGAIPASAQWAVFDVPNLMQSVLNYAAMAEQIAKQATQIKNQIDQIRQFETQLNRMGDMKNFRNLVGFSEFRADLNLPTQIRTWADGLSRVDGSGLFGDSRGGVFKPVNAQFTDFDGRQIDRDPQIFKESHDMAVTVDEFKAVQSDVYSRRENLKRAIATTSEAMQAATTEAEQQKLQAVLNAQYGQLSAVDAEVALSAAEVQVKAAEATAMKNAQTEADAEARRRLSQQEVKKISTTFTPTYECMLQYVTERRLSE